MSDTPDAGRTLAHYATSLTLADIPAAVTDRVKHCLLDFFGVTISAAAESPDFDRSIAALTAVNGNTGNATVIGRSYTASIETAAFANALLAHTYDFDDTNVAGFFHPGAGVHPATLAFAEAANTPGERVLIALVAGYEIASRVGAALGESTYDRGFHITPVAGIFGGTAAAALVNNFDATQLDQAFGLSGSQAAGSMQYLANGAWNKRFHPAFVSRAAVNSIALIGAGALGAVGALDGRYGLMHGYSAAPNIARLTDNLGDEWLALATGIKPYPSCRFTHGAVDAAVELYGKVPAHILTDPTSHIEVRIAARAYAIVGTDEPHKRAPQTMVDGQFSVYFQVAAALLTGRVTTAAYQHLTEPTQQALMRRMHVITDDTIAPFGARITVRSANGETFTSIITLPGGEPPDNVGEQVVVNKFTALTDGVLAPPVTQQIIETVMTLETQASVAPILKATTGLLQSVRV